MKRKILALFLIACCLVITGCARTITYKDFKDKVKNKESFVVEVIQTGCSHCEKFQPVFDKFANKYNIEYVKLNLSNVTGNDGQDLNSKYNIPGTPTILIFKDGMELEEFKISGEVPTSTLEKTFKKAGYIK